MCTCVGPLDSIVMGSMTVLIGGKPAARMGDSCAHGGVIAFGFSMVLIGGAKTVNELALLNANIMLQNKLDKLKEWDKETKASVKKWMGDDSELTKKMLEGRIKRMLKAIKDMDESNFKRAKKGKDKVFAYVYPTDKKHKIYLGKLYDTAPDTGENSKAGTIIHEVSHFNNVVGTDDVVHPSCPGKSNKCYGTKNAENLALKSSTDAKKNADNFEYFMEH